MLRPFARHGLLVLLLAGTGCDDETGAAGDAGDSGSDAAADVQAEEDPEPVASGAELLAGAGDLIAPALCERHVRCSAHLFGALFSDVAQCEAIVEDWLTASAPPLADAIDAGTIAFDAAGVDTCLAALGQEDCNAPILDGMCSGLIVGQLDEEEGCMLDQECAAGLHCDAPGLFRGCQFPMPALPVQHLGHCTNASDGTCGTCRPRAPRGEACGATPCVENHRCRDGVCRPVHIAEGMGCSVAGAFECAGDLACVGTGEPTCRAPAVAGEDCDVDLLTAPDCDFAGQGHACHVSGVCLDLNLRGPGDPCNEIFLCQAGLYCTANELCAPRRELDESCTVGSCAYGLTCDEGTCRPLAADASSCDEAYDCASYWCAGPDGAGTCGAIAWADCR